MKTGVIAALVAVLSLGFIEGLRRFYPARQTWRRLRRARGRRGVRAMRKRFEDAGANKTPRTLAIILLAVVPPIWFVSVKGLDNEWYEAAATVLPYAFVAFALARTPGALRRVGERMKRYEEEAGDDPDRDDDGDTDVLAL